MDYFVSLRKRLLISIGVMVIPANIILFICMIPSFSVLDSIFTAIALILLSTLLISLLSRLCFFIIASGKTSFINSKKNIRSILFIHYASVILILFIYACIITFTFFIEQSDFSIGILLAPGAGMFSYIIYNRFFLYNEDFIVHNMGVFLTKDIKDCWICKNSGTPDTLKILLKSGETIEVISSSYIDLDAPRDLIKSIVFSNNCEIT